MQTSDVLRGDGQVNSLLPNITAPIVGSSNITFSWDRPPRPYDGLSVLVNDVERHRWYYGEGDPSHTFEKPDGIDKDYFRFAYMSGSQTEDYTKAGVWESDRWRHMKPGPSK